MTLMNVTQWATTGESPKASPRRGEVGLVDRAYESVPWHEYRSHEGENDTGYQCETRVSYCHH